MNSLYLLVDGFTILVPAIFSFHPKLKFYEHFNAFFLANFIAAFTFIVWDIYFTHLGVWGFNPQYLLGLNIANLPIEEILFFICIPFACVFTYHCFNLFYDFTWSVKTTNWVTLIFALVLLVLGIIFFHQKYTATTFISLAILLIVIQFIFNVQWLSKLYTIYPVLLIPFFIVNGILTGSGLEQPVVWYNNAENLSFRLFTIPVEDVFYGFELILLTIFFYEVFKTTFKQKTSSPLKSA